MVFPPEDVLFSQAFNFHFQICGNDGHAVELLPQVLHIQLHSLPATLLGFVSLWAKRRHNVRVENCPVQAFVEGEVELLSLCRELERTTNQPNQFCF